jgi:hypothetical protein
LIVGRYKSQLSIIFNIKIYSRIKIDKEDIIMLRGSMFIIDDISKVNLMNTIIVDMDEDNNLYNLNNIVKGTLLLPPPQAMMAESDGNEMAYDEIYIEHLMSPKIREFISTLISCLYKGFNVLFYLPDSGYDNTRVKFTYHLFNLYGVHPGIPESNNPRLGDWYCDMNRIPMWLDMIYLNGVISPYEFLVRFPLECIISEKAIEKLLLELKPYGNTVEEMINNLLDYRHKIKYNHKLEMAIGYNGYIGGII